MNTIIQAQLDRVETALNTLIESIASYNPSIPAANALLAADDDLNNGLKQCTNKNFQIPEGPTTGISLRFLLSDISVVSAHQCNHARIQSLRRTIEQQNASITDTLTTLASTRADLLSTPSSLPQKDARNVPYNELLDYAKRISRYTVPPTFRPGLPPAQTALPPAVNGDTVAIEEGGHDIKEEKEGRGTASLEDVERKWLDPLNQIPFVPWVSDETIKRGALAEIQSMVERGQDPENVGAGVSEEQKAETMETGKGEDAVEREAGVSADGGTGMQRREEKPKVFGGLDLYDPHSPDVDDD
ncbi:hypothetical protein IMSHALPRED_008184 [Imshaugia aleurites]|uniref:Mediator of RNA polymerase II transcription subunit 4 n=1 Tax=Imshaugia aleurites TaxID=172621 RepID=A0A8H3FWQ5_9LECA|nr:hypothetical protein IMSHALPRED_008184 [Imshaugia aleurites]